jgi:hypothetical protein
MAGSVRFPVQRTVTLTRQQDQVVGQLMTRWGLCRGGVIRLLLEELEIDADSVWLHVDECPDIGDYQERRGRKGPSGVPLRSSPGL